MAAPYSGTSVSGYNANPPPDDGSSVSTNLITWAGIKSKVGDPLNTFATAVDANITTAFTKTLDGSAVVATGVNYAAGAADQGRLINVTASGVTVTTPDAGTVGTPFIFGVTNRSTGTISLAPNATNSQTIDGGTSALVIQIGGSCLVKTDGTNWFTINYKPGSNALAANNYGFDSPVNANIQCSVGSNLLTVALKTKAGNDPSASDPVLVPFRDTTLTTGDPVWVSITSALSISTNATGASLGTQNNVPFRLWILLFNNAGTPVLALWHSGAGASSIAINPLNESTLQSTTGISAGATSAGVFYTPNGTSLSSKAFRILGYLEYTAGLATAGTYASAPSIVQLFGPGIKKPGDIVQSIYATTTSTTNINSSSAKVATSLTAPVAAISNANPWLVDARGYILIPSLANNVAFQIFRNTGAAAFGSVSNNYGNSGANSGSTVACIGLDAPASSNWPPTQYGLYGLLSSGGSSNTWLGTGSGFTGQGAIIAQEIMG